MADSFLLILDDLTAKLILIREASKHSLNLTLVYARIRQVSW